MINVLVKNPGQKIKKVQTRSKIGYLQDLVGGYLEIVRWRNGMHLYVNEEGLILDLPRCCFDGAIFAGPVVVSKIDSEGYDIGLTDEECAKVIASAP